LKYYSWKGVGKIVHASYLSFFIGAFNIYKNGRHFITPSIDIRGFQNKNYPKVELGF
jgi:hypothetical protein